MSRSPESQPDDPHSDHGMHSRPPRPQAPKASSSGGDAPSPASSSERPVGRGSRPPSPGMPPPVDSPPVKSAPTRASRTARPTEPGGPAPARRTSRPPQRKVPQQRTPPFRTLYFKQTVIPILLTTGGICLILGAFKFPAAPENALTLLPVDWSVLMICGAALIAVAVINMLSVRGELARNARAPLRSMPSP